MASRNNTTPIGDGQVGIDPNIRGVAAQEIQKTISENNLKWQLGQNSKVKGVYNATMQMLSRWTRADKIRIIQQFGNVEGLSSNPSDDELSQFAAMALISNMNQDDLKRLIGAEEAKATQLAREVAAINARTLTQAQRSLNIGNINAKAADGGRQMADPTQMRKMLKKTGFQIDKIWSKTAIPQLDKDIREVLANFTPIELAQEATLLGIEFEDGSSKGELIRQILNKVDMYASLILGKQKGVFALGMDEAQIAEVEKLIGFSPKYAWVAGKVVAPASEIMSKRKAANAAKRKTEAMKKNVKARDKNRGRHDRKGNIKPKDKLNKLKGNSFTTKFNAGLHYVKTNRVLNGLLSKGHGYGAQNHDQIVKQLNLDSLTDDEIRALGAQVGIRNYETDDIENIKKEILAQAIGEANDIQKDRLRAENIRDPKKRKKRMDAVNDRMSNSLTAAIAATKAANNAKQIANEMSDKTPVVSFNENGEVISEAITKAVPVYIMGSADHAGRQMSHEDAEKMRTENAAKASGVNNIKNLINILDAEYGAETKETGLIGRAFRRLRGKNGLKMANRGVTRNVDESTLLDISDNDVDNHAYAKNNINALLSQPPIHGYGIAGGPSTIYDESKKSLIDKLKENATNIKNGAINKIATALGSTGSGIDDDWFNSQRKNNTDSSISLLSAKSMLNADAMELLNTNTMQGDQIGIAKTHVMPVFNIGGYTPILNAMDGISSSLDGISTSLTALPIYFAGLQEGGTVFNAASAGASAGYATTLAQDLANASSELITFNYSQHATGGSMSAKTSAVSPVSRIITGDSPFNKNNTELVSVDWKNKRMNVQPIPKMATGGTVSQKTASDNSNITNVHRLSTGDRNKPLQVGIAAGLVTYSSSISGDYADDGTKTAVKVYSVNGGIQSKIKVGDSEMSLFDAVYGIYSSLPQITAAITNNSQILTTIATNTAQTASNTAAAASHSGNSSDFEFTTSLDDILAGK